jgi:hypothetical protein
MVMSSLVLRRYLEPLLHNSKTAHVSTLRIGAKSLSFWPYRYTTDPDAGEVLRLFSEIVRVGKASYHPKPISAIHANFLIQRSMML